MVGVKSARAWLVVVAIATGGGCARPAAQVRPDEAGLGGVRLDDASGEPIACAAGNTSVPEPPAPTAAEVEAARTACAAGDPARCHFFLDHLGAKPCSDAGDGLAIEFLENACAGGDRAGCAPLAVVCDPTAWRRALDELRADLERRCEVPEARACALASMMADNSVGIPARDGARFARLATAACDAGEGDRCNYLALLATRGELPGANVAQARAWNERAAELWKRGCDGGDAGDCLELGSAMLMRWTYGPAHEPPGIPQELTTGLRVYARACPGEPVACYGVGQFREAGRLVPRDLAGAAGFYRRACDGGFQRACNDLGRMHAFGLGVAQDCAQARALFRKTCEAGSQTGCFALRRGVSPTTSFIDLF
jgi:TPR repeat protein